MRLEPGDARLTAWAPQPVARDRRELRFDRFPRAAAEHLAGRIGPLANLRSSAGCWLALATDAPAVTVHLDRLRHHQPTACGIDLEVVDAAGRSVAVTASCDLREQSGQVAVRLATGLAPGSVQTCRIHLPCISTVAIAAIEVPDGATVAPAPPAPAPSLLALGDSLTQGFCVQQPTQGWVPRVCGPRGWTAWNLGVGGITIEPEVFSWALAAQSWPVVVVALGSNHAWRGVDAATAAERAAAMADLVVASQPGQAVWVLPPWKPCEDGLGPSEFMGVPLDAASGARAHRVRRALAEVLAGYPSITVVEDPMPHDHRLYPDGLHPAAIGFASYAQAIEAVLSL